MKNLFWLIASGVLLYVVVGGQFPQLSLLRGNNSIVYGETQVGSDDVFVGLHLATDENGSQSVQGVSQLGKLLTNVFWEKLFATSELDLLASTEPVAVANEANTNGETEVLSYPCDESFVDIDENNLAESIRILANYCVVYGGVDHFYPQNYIRRAELSKMMVGAMMHRMNDGVMTPPPPPPHGGPVRFEDMENHALRDYVVYLDTLGLARGLIESENLFGPNEYVSSSDLYVLVQDVISQYDEYIDSSYVVWDMSQDRITRDQAAGVVAALFFANEEVNHDSMVTILR